MRLLFSKDLIKLSIFVFFLEDDFIDFCDLFLACIILQKQIERIDGKKENIIVPSVRINAIREQELVGKKQ